MPEDKQSIEFSSGKKKLEIQNIASSIEESSKIKSEVGAQSFAFKIAYLFVSTELKSGDKLEKYMTEEARTQLLPGMIQRNKSTILPAVTFSPIGVASDYFEGNQARVAVVGLSFSSQTGIVTSAYKEVLLKLVFDENWKIDEFILSDVKGPKGDGSAVDSEQAAVLSGFNFPSDDFLTGKRPVVSDSFGLPTTQPFAPGE